MFLCFYIVVNVVFNTANIYLEEKSNIPKVRKGVL